MPIKPTTSSKKSDETKLTTKPGLKPVVKPVKTTPAKDDKKVKEVKVKETKVKEKEEEQPVPDSTPDDSTPDDSSTVTSDKKSSPKKKPIPTFKFDGELEDVEKQVEDMLKDIDEMHKKVNSEFTVYKHFIKDLSKALVRMRKKDESQKSKKASSKSGKRISPEFPISDELAVFMGMEAGSKTSRTNALAVVSKYVKEHDLNGIDVDDGKGGSKKDGRLINLDDALEKIFPNLVGCDEYLKFTTIITHLNQHFPKKESTVVAEE